MVVLAGGIGSRFWPLSTPSRPKQLLPLAGDEPLLVETIRRLTPVAPAERMLILTNSALVEAISALLPEVPRANIIAEPKPAGTAAALTWAALEIERREGPDSVMLSVHADWAIRDADEFRSVLLRAAEVAESTHSLVTVGVVPTRADTGFGYIQPAAGDASRGVAVSKFMEKPDRASAERMVAAGALWNSGIFVWRVSDFLSEARALTPELAKGLQIGDTDAGTFFSVVTPISVDVGVLERSAKVMVLAGAFGWDDIGTWAALQRSKETDADGNAAHGDIHFKDASNNVVHAESGSVILYGVSGLVVVTHDGVTLVTTIDNAADLKTLVDSLPTRLRERS